MPLRLSKKYADRYLGAFSYPLQRRFKSGADDRCVWFDRAICSCQARPDRLPEVGGRVCYLIERGGREAPRFSCRALGGRRRPGQTRSQGEPIPPRLNDRLQRLPDPSAGARLHLMGMVRYLG